MGLEICEGGISLQKMSGVGDGLGWDCGAEGLGGLKGPLSPE